MITFVNSLDPDQARQNVRPDLFDTLIVFLKSGNWLVAHRADLILGKTTICIFAAKFYGRIPFLSPTRTLSVVQELRLYPNALKCLGKFCKEIRYINIYRKFRKIKVCVFECLSSIVSSLWSNGLISVLSSWHFLIIFINCVFFLLYGCKK